MTWAELKLHFEENGVLDDSEINFIDLVGSEELEEIAVVVDEDGVQIF